MIIQMVALNSKHRTNRKQRNHRKTIKTSFLKEQVEKADLDKPVLNKIMITRDKRITYNFVAPLTSLLSQTIFLSNFDNIRERSTVT